MLEYSWSLCLLNLNLQKGNMVYVSLQEKIPKPIKNNNTDVCTQSIWITVLQLSRPQEAGGEWVRSWGGGGGGVYLQVTP